MSNYAIYKSRGYQLNVLDDQLEIISHSKDSVKYGFKELKFEQGFITQVLYTKKVDINDIEMAYKLEYKVIYKGTKFDPLSISKHVLDENSIGLFTNNEKEAKEYGFIKKEQFIFEKKVPLDEIEVLIEIKKPIFKFQYMEVEKTIIQQKDLREYLKNMLI
ncbi:hypothetical protein [Abyssisolibacter fermentans]|uniref:hypothetical protein n=1 Tax=Abyssisolibacter fermentans TaxID=1766203 RepID=UPI00083569EF|nr:hypothetical protein [Abyssisolibacter fermentans]